MSGCIRYCVSSICGGRTVKSNAVLKQLWSSCEAVSEDHACSLNPKEAPEFKAKPDVQHLRRAQGRTLIDVSTLSQGRLHGKAASSALLSHARSATRTKARLSQAHVPSDVLFDASACTKGECCCTPARGGQRPAAAGRARRATPFTPEQNLLQWFPSHGSLPAPDGRRPAAAGRGRRRNRTPTPPWR